MSTITTGQSTFAYSYFQLRDLLGWIRENSSLAHAVYGFMEHEGRDAAEWLIWFEFAEKLRADPDYLFKAFPDIPVHSR